MTIERSIIRLIIPTANNSTIDPHLEVSWYSRHPGDKVENHIKSYINNKLTEDGNNFSHFILIEEELVFINWNHSLKAGVAILLDLLSIPLWSQYIWRFHTHNPKNWENLFEEYLDVKHEKPILSDEKSIDPSWLKSTLEGGTVEFDSHNKEQFIQQIQLVFETFPWTSLLLKSGKIKDNKTVLIFQSGDISQEISYEDIFIRFAGEEHDEFWSLITRSIIRLSQLPNQDRLAFIRKSLQIIHEVTDNEKQPLDRLSNIKNYISALLDLDIDFTQNYITKMLLDISNLQPKFDIGLSLLNIAEILLNNNLSEFAKLAEGTALQIALSLESNEQKKKILLELAHRSNIWSTGHLIAFIQSITSLLSESEEDKKILSDILEFSTDFLKSSWEGLMCLVETNLTIGVVMKAIELRFHATEQIIDQHMRAEDIFNAINWSLTVDGLLEQEFSEMHMNKIEKAITHFPIGELLHDKIKEFILICLENQRFLVLKYFIDWLNHNILKIGISDRLPIFQLIDELLSENKKYIRLRVPVFLHLFKQLLEEKSHENYEKADNLLRSIYNLIDPSIKNYEKLISQITNSFIISAGQFGELELIEEAKKRFSLMIKEEELARKEILTSLITSGNTRLKMLSDSINENDIGFTLYDQAITLSNIENDAEQVLEFLPDAKKFSFKAKSYSRYAKYTIIEARYKKSLDLPWVVSVIQSAKSLLNKGEIQETNIIFSDMLEFDLTDEEEYDILSKQLDLVEIEPDYISADDIFAKRNRLILLANSTQGLADTHEILQNYRNGISELISKGDAVHLNDLLFGAIEFSHENNLIAVSEFTDILLDSFLSNLSAYQSSKNTIIYNNLLLTFRKILSTFQYRNIDLSISLATELIKTNIELAKQNNYDVFLKRGQLICSEISYIIATADKESIAYNIEEKNELIHLYQKLISTIIEKNPIFGPINAVLHATNFYYQLNEQEKLFNLLDKTLGRMKKSAVKAKTITSSLLLGLILLSEMFIILDGQFNDQVCSALQERATKILDIMSTFKLDSEIKKKFNNIRRKMHEHPRQALEEFPFSIEIYLQSLDQRIH